MATATIPTPEQNRERKHRYRARLRAVETWQLELWFASSDNDWKAEAIADELKARKEECTGF